MSVSSSSTFTESSKFLTVLLYIDDVQPSIKVDEDTKWKTRELSQIHTVDPVGMDRKSRLHTILENSVLA